MNMEASIEGDDGDHLKVFVTDEQGVKHEATIEAESGEIVYHDQNGYPAKPSDRTDEQGIRIEQAHEYAKYHVQRERGYRTLAPRLNPEWLAIVTGAAAALSPAAFEEHFGPYLQQFHSSVRPSIPSIVEIPWDRAGGAIAFRADVYVGVPFESYLEDPDAVSPIAILGELTDEYEVLSGLADHVEELLEPGAEPIEAVSSLEVLYQERAADGSVAEPTIGERTATLDRPADARLEMMPRRSDLEQDLPQEVLRTLVLHHLSCQVRDAYLRLGLEPPQAFRVLGHGLYRQSIRSEYTDLYPPYQFTDAEIEGYRPPGEDIELPAESPLSGADGGSLRRLIRQVLFG